MPGRMPVTGRSDSRSVRSAKSCAKRCARVSTRNRGGGTDVLGRAFAKELTAELGQNVIVEKIGGAAGFIGTQEAVGATPDGYTILFAPAAPYTLATHSTPPATYDPETQLIPVAQIAVQPTLFTVRKDAGFATLEDFITAAKAAPGI